MPALVGMNPTNVYTDAELLRLGTGFGPGDQFEDSAGNQYVFVRATAALGLGDVVQYSNSYGVGGAGTVAPLTTATAKPGWKVGVALTAVPANSWGWLCIYGNVPFNTLAGCLPNVRLNTVANSGSVDDDGTAASFEVWGLHLAVARAGNPTLGVVNYPIVRGPAL